MTAAEKSRIYTVTDLAGRYRVPAQAIRNVVDRLELGRRVGRWRAVGEADLAMLETGLKALGHNTPSTTTAGH